MRRTTSLIIASILALVGVYLGRYGFYAWEVLAFGVVLLLISKNSRRSILLWVIVFIFANYRGFQVDSQYKKYEALFYQKVSISGIAEEDAEYNDKKQLSVVIGGLQSGGMALPGKIEVSGYGVRSMLRGETILAEGKLYPARGSLTGRISFGNLSVIAPDTSWYNGLRRTFIKRLRNRLPEPSSSLAAGLIIGQRSTLSKEVTESFRATGLSHIIAVSGYNLTILSSMLLVVFSRVSRVQRAFMTLLATGIFSLFSGISASIARAAIVVMISLIAWYYGRTVRPLQLVCMSAAISTLISPRYIWSDIGWTLSFLAFAGVVLVAPAVKQVVLRKPVSNTLVNLFIETLSVLLVVTPYSLYIFGNFQVYAILVNLIIVPLVPAVMIAAMAAIFVPYSLGILLEPLRLMMVLFTAIPRFFAGLPYAQIPLKLTLTKLIAYYLVGALLLWLATKIRPKSTEYTSLNNGVMW